MDTQFNYHRFKRVVQEALGNTTYERLSERTGIPVGTLFNASKGKGLRMATFVKLCSAFNQHPMEFFEINE